MSVILSRNERPSTVPVHDEERKFSAYCEEIDDLLSDSEEEIEEQVFILNLL
jgi:hypothetical protein